LASCPAGCGRALCRVSAKPCSQFNVQELRFSIPSSVSVCLIRHHSSLFSWQNRSILTGTDKAGSEEISARKTLEHSEIKRTNDAHSVVGDGAACEILDYTAFVKCKPGRVRVDVDRDNLSCHGCGERSLVEERNFLLTACEKTSARSTFPMFIPSLSWQTFVFLV
jgi:hypothetical protein